MAIIRGTNKIMKADIPGAPPWFDKVLSALNSFLDTVIGALRGKLTFRENFYCEEKEYTFVHAVEKKILMQKVDAYKGLLIVTTPEEESDDYAVSAFKVRRKDPTTIGLTVYFQGVGVTEGKVKFLILG